jgi:hypothetical protein
MQSENKIMLNDCFDKYINNELSISIDDESRKILPWSKYEEQLLKKWGSDCRHRSGNHDSKGASNKIKYATFGIPTILIPIILGGFSSVFPCHSLVYGVAMMCSGAISAVNMFFNFGRKSEVHYNFACMYFELSNEIESELIKPKKFRMSCSVYVEKIKHKYNNLLKQAPALSNVH